MKRIKNILNFAVFSFIILSLAIAFVITPDSKVSVAERRQLKSFDEVKTAENPFDEFEGYFLDQFPLRDKFRAVKAHFNTSVVRKNDNNKLYIQNGSIVKIEDALDEKQVNTTIKLINDVKDRFFKDKKIYYSIIPDKHYYASKENGYPAMDYEKMLAMLSEGVNGEYIDIVPTLSLAHYYTTDSHWSQDKIVNTAQTLVGAMNEQVSLVPDGEGFTVNTLEPFCGVYYGQWAINVPADKMNYLTSKNTHSMTMTVINDKGFPEKKPVYTTEYFSNVDPYDVFTAGAQPYITIENPNASTNRQLVLFRDSFGSSIAPIFAEGYAKVTMIDLRYMFPDAVGNMLGKTGDDTDVLFLYSTGLVNGGGTLRTFMNTK